LGGDAFGLWYDSKSRKVEGLNGSGRSAAALDLSVVEKFYGSLCKEMEGQFAMGVHSITVPGAAKAWEDVHERWGSGRFTLMQLFEPAVQLGT
jgi:gamma-glutamyltranspeptidase/glutathione hydrolase